MVHWRNNLKLSSKRLLKLICGSYAVDRSTIFHKAFELTYHVYFCRSRKFRPLAEINATDIEYIDQPDFSRLNACRFENCDFEKGIVSFELD